MSKFEQANLISWARHLARRGKLQDLFDPALQSMDQDQALLCITVAFIYLQLSLVKRPSTKEVVGMLSGDFKPPHLPVEFSLLPPSSLFKSRKKARAKALKMKIKEASSQQRNKRNRDPFSQPYVDKSVLLPPISTFYLFLGKVLYVPGGTCVVHFPCELMYVIATVTRCLSIVVLGASRDLAKKKTFPTLYNLYRQANKKNDEAYTQVTLFLEPENNVAKLLKIALDDGMDKEPNVPLPCLEVSLLELLPVVPVEPGGVELDSHSSCNLQVIFTSTQLFLLLMGREIYHRDLKGILDEILAYDQGVREGAFGLLLNSGPARALPADLSGDTLFMAYIQVPINGIQQMLYFVYGWQLEISLGLLQFYKSFSSGLKDIVWKSEGNSEETRS
ncbi:hypothetical protein GIB67_032539 [Kingdonia uniflora]|uniref:Uncharacterized protein n=1 Tax=Kingdonia uniflora TaxID=39325 RepID=A0A7J7L7L5_9MAGN|nr:hypothetical protein GIB67_032539 [Kingdonia uniflora]